MMQSRGVQSATEAQRPSTSQSFGDALGGSLSQAFINYYGLTNQSAETTSFSEQLAMATEALPGGLTYTAESGGMISFVGGSIGPFVGDWQGIPRNQLIAERLSQLQESDLQSTDVRLKGGSAIIHIGSTSFELTAADVAAQDQGSAPNPAWTAAVMTLSALGAKVPEKTLRQIRGELAAKQARITYQEGQQRHGNGSWETNGANRGPLITPLKESNRASSRDNYEWCGMYVGHAFKKAGIREEILRSLVFWSGYRLHLFFTKGEDVSKRKIGDFWQPHDCLSLNFTNDTRRKAAFDAFNPEAGDVVLFGSNYTHVAIVDSYDAETGNLEILEGNSGNRVQATTFGTGDDRITYIGRFNDSDFGSNVDQGLLEQDNPAVSHDDERNGRTSWRQNGMYFS